MNHTYRTVWNASLGSFVAVSESGPRRGKRAGAVKPALAVALALMATSAAIAPQARAQQASVAVQSGQTSAFLAGNGVTVVNIAAPNAAGLSHNLYSRFNVDPAGLVLNNGDASQALRQSQLAGLLAANPNLTRPANVILNEVVSNNRSTLAGFTEVLGGKADVVLANPYGITCSGCGFINTDRVVLTTGNPFLAADGSLGGFAVGQGDILITGTGLNASAQQVLDLVTRSLRIDAPINAQDLGVTTGANSWNYATRDVNGPGSGGVGTASYSIDSSALGGMYANRIRLTATEAGVGVRMLGDAAASIDDFTLTAQGEVQLRGRLSAARDLAVTSLSTGAGALAVTDASLSAGRDLSLGTRGGVVLQGGALVAGNQLTVSASSLNDSASTAALQDNNRRHAGNASTLNIVGDAALGATTWSAANAWEGRFGNLRTTAQTQLTSSNGTLLASASNGDLALGLAALSAAGDLTLSASLRIDTAAGAGQGVQSRAGNVSLTATGWGNGGVLSADAGSVLVRVDGDLDNAGQIHAAQTLDIADRSGGAGQRIANSGKLIADGALALRAASASNATGAFVQAGAQSTVDVGSLGNAGSWLLSTQAGGTDRVTVAGALTGAGSLQSAGGLDLGAGTIDNQGAIQAAAALAVRTQGALGNAGRLQAGTTLAIDSVGAIVNRGALTGSALAIAGSQGFDNTGTAAAIAGNANVRVDGTITNGGVLQSAGAIDIAGRQGAATPVFDNAGNVLAAQGLSLGASRIVNQASGWIQAASGSAVAGDSLDNRGTWLLSTQGAAADTVRVGGALTNAAAATLQSAGALSIVADPFGNSGAVLAARDLRIDGAGSVANSAGGTVQAGGALTVSSTGALSNAASATLRGGTVALSAVGLGNAGVIDANTGDLALRVDGTLTNSGQLHAAGSIDIDDRAQSAQQVVVNAGRIVADDALALRAVAVTNTGRVQAGRTSTVVATQVSNDGGTWLLSQRAGATDLLAASGVLANTGTVQSAGDVTVVAGTIDNDCALIAARDLAATLGSRMSNGATGVVQASRTLTIGGPLATLANQAGGRLLGDQLAIDVNAIDNGGTIRGGSQASTVRAATLNNRAGGLIDLATRASGSGVVSTGSFTNAGTLQSAGALTVSNTGLSGGVNSGSLLSAGDLTLQLNASPAQFSIPAGGLVQSGGLLSVAGAGGTRLGVAGTLAGESVDLVLDTLTLRDNGIVAADGDLSVDARSFVNGAGTRLLGATGGTGTAVITLATPLSNTGLLFSGSDLTVRAPDVVNTDTGGIAASRDLSASATTGDLTNRGALYAGRSLVASALNGTLVNDATLQGYLGTMDAGGLLRLAAPTVVNRSTISSDGDVRVDAQAFRNEVVGGDTRQWGANGAMTTVQTGHDAQGYHGCGCVDQSEYWYYATTWNRDQYYAGGTPTVRPQMTAAGTLTLSFNSGANLGGVLSGDTVRLIGTGAGARFVNDDLSLQRQSFTQTYTLHTKFVAAGPATYYERRVEDDTTTQVDSTLSSIGASVHANTLDAGGFALVNAGSPAAAVVHAVQASAPAPGSLLAHVGAVGGLAATPFAGAAALDGRTAISFIAVNVANGVSGTSFGGIRLSLPTNPNGFFVTTRSPDARYLVELNPLYTLYTLPTFGMANLVPVSASGNAFPSTAGSTSALMGAGVNPVIAAGSDYLADLLGYDPDKLVRRLGDASYEAYLVKQQLIAQTGGPLLAGAADAASQVKKLMDNAAADSRAIGLVYGEALTPAQQAALAHDIVWMVQTEIGGQIVLAPVVYLAPQTRAEVVQGAAITADTARLSLTSLTNTGGTLAAGRSLQVVSAGDITNTSGTIRGGDVALTSTGGSIVNQTASSGSGSDTRYVTDIGKTATIASTGVLALTAAKDITSSGATVDAGGDAALKAGGSVVFDTIENKNTATTRSSSQDAFSSATSTTTTTTVDQVKSGLTVGGSLQADAGKDITIAGSDVKVAGDAALSAGGAVNIVARENSTTSATQSTSSGFGRNNSLYSASRTESTTEAVRNVGSSVQIGGNANIAASGDVTVQGSTLAAGGSGAIAAANVNVLAGRDYDAVTSKTTTVNALQVVNGSTQSTSSGSSSGSGSTQGLTANGTATGAASAGKTSTGGLAFASGSTATTATTDQRSVGSSLSFGGNVTVDASKDVTLQGSTLVTGGNATVNATNVNLLAAENRSTSQTSTNSGSFGLMGRSTNQVAASGTASGDAGAGLTPSASANATGSASASTSNTVDLAQRSTTNTQTTDLTHQGSAIQAGGSIAVDAAKDLNLQGSTLGAAQDVRLGAANINSVASNDVHETRTATNSSSFGWFANGQASASAQATAGTGGLPGVNVSGNASASLGGGLYGANSQSTTVQGSTTANVSDISAGGDVSRRAGGTITDVGTQIQAGGNFSQSAETITSLAAANTTYASTTGNSNTARLGAFGEVSAPVTLAVSPLTGAVVQVVPDVGAGLRLSYQNQQGSSQSASSTAVASDIRAGGNVSSSSTGKTMLEGTRIAAGGDATLTAGTLDYAAARNTAGASSTQRTGGGEVTLDVVNRSLTGTVSVGGTTQGSASSTAVAGSVTSGGALRIGAQGDARLEGTQLGSGGATTLTTGGNLAFDAATSTSTSNGQTTSASVEGGVERKKSGKMAGIVEPSMGYSQTSSDGSTAAVGSITSGGPVTVSSGGDATLTGTAIRSAGDTTVAAAGDLTLGGARSTSRQSSAGTNASFVDGQANAAGNSSEVKTSQTTGGSIASAGNVALSSGRNATLDSTTVAAAGSTSLNAGANATLAGAAVASQGNTTIAAGKDLVVGAARNTDVRESTGVNLSAANSGAVGGNATHTESTGGARASTLSAGGAVSLSSGASAGGGERVVVASNRAGGAPTFTASVPVPASLPRGAAVTATTADGKALPSWLQFDPKTGSFQGTPPADFKGGLQVTVSVPQGDGSVRTIPLTFGSNEPNPRGIPNGPSPQQ